MARKRYYLADNQGRYDATFKTKRAAVKELASIVREAASDCRNRYKRCSVVGTAASGSVQIKIGGRQGYHMWNRYVINEGR